MEKCCLSIVKNSRTRFPHNEPEARKHHIHLKEGASFACCHSNMKQHETLLATPLKRPRAQLYSPIWFIMSISSASVMLYPSDVTNFFSSVAVIQPSPLLSNTWKASLISRIWSAVSFVFFSISSSCLDVAWILVLLLFCLFAERLSLSTVLLSSSSTEISSSSDIENRSLPDSSSVKAEVDSRAFFGDKSRLDGSTLSVLLLLSSVVPLEVEGGAFPGK